MRAVPQFAGKIKDQMVFRWSRKVPAYPPGFLTALKALLDAGGGSRGAYVVLDEQGDRVVETRRGREMPHRGENLAMRGEILEVELDPAGGFRTFVTPVRPLPEDDSWYENTWRAWRDGEVFQD